MKVLIVDDEAGVRSSLKGLLKDEGYAAETASSGEAALRLLAEHRFDALILDVMMPGLDGIEVLRRAGALCPFLKIVMMSGHADLSTAVEATRLGALDFFEKPLNGDKVILAMRAVSRQISLEKQVSSLERLIGEECAIIGESGPMLDLKQEIQKAAPSNSRILIRGENGTGKELVARTVHLGSARKINAFISLNCAAIPAALVESELFGHEKGAFTGAVSRKPGRFEIADGGTLFLDEIGDMSLEAQSKLLRVLEENEAVRVGGTQTYSFDVRVIAATNKDLETEIGRGAFREDLYYRLNVIPMLVPPLRDRLTDVPLLAVHFLHSLGAHTAARAREFTAGALHELSCYQWPGNVRELRNIVERLMIMSPSDRITAADVEKALPAGRHAADDAEPAAGFSSGKSFREMVAGFEEQLLLKGYRTTGGNVSELSRLLQMDRANLHRKLKTYGIK